MITKSIVNKDGAIITSTFKFYATEEIIMMSPRGKDEATSNRPSSVLFVYVRCYKINNRNDRIKETRQEYPKQSPYPTI